MNSRERVNAAVERRAPDRVPVDFLATTEIWRALERHFGLDPFSAASDEDTFDPQWEKILDLLQVDCRVVSYDQFCAPPTSAFPGSGDVEWWDVMSRSTPARMWRFKADDGFAHDIFGRRFRVQANDRGSYEENVPSLAEATSLDEIKAFHWADPSWWDFSGLEPTIRRMNRNGPKHIRYRMGSVFEIAWQLRGMDTFFMDLALQPEIPAYMMDRIAELCAENAAKALDVAGDAIDMVYFYDDIASNSGMMISMDMWREFIKPQHQKLIEVAKSRGKKVMYHSDGSLATVLDELIDMGVDVLNPLQPNTKDMESEKLKAQYGDRLSFHGGIDIVGLLPSGKPEEVRVEAKRMMDLLGRDGGYILASSHHIQPDTPIENVLALYEIEHR